MFFDTSVIVALYVPERATASAQAAVKDVVRPYINPLVCVEFASALARRYRDRELEEADARSLIEIFRTHVDEGRFGMMEISPDIYRRAEIWVAAMRTPLRTADAIHLATAHHSQLRLVTLDRQLNNAAQTLGVSAKLLK